MATIELNDTITLSIAVKDRHKSAQWFKEHLGFKTLYDADEIGWIELQTSTVGVTLGLSDTDQPSPGNCVPVFGVTDINQARSALEAKDVSFDGETMHVDNMVSIATFYDLDGNAFMLAQDHSISDITQ